MAKPTRGQRIRATLSLKQNYEIKPFGFKWRCNTFFILTTVAVGMFSDLFLYSLVVPILPFILEDRLGLPYSKVQSSTSGLLAIYAASSVVLCPIAGAISDKMNSRQIPFLAGLSALILSTLMLLLGRTMPVLVIARIFQGASSAFVWTVGMTLALDTVGPQNLGKTIGSLFSFASVGELFAPVVGGALYKQSGTKSVLALSLSLLVVDLIMRLLVIEKKHAALFEDTQDDHSATQQPTQTATGPTANHTENTESPSETSALLPNDNTKPTDPFDDIYLIPANQPAIVNAAPILYPLMHSPALAASNLLTFTSAFLLAAYDATVPTHARELYGFDSLKVGLLFIPLSVLSLIFGPFGGWAVDRWGTKFGSVVGFTWLVPCLVLLRLPQAKPFPQQVILWGGILALMGIGTAIGGSPGIVEAGAVLERYHTRNPEFFGPNGPYAQLYGVVSMVFNLGMALGPVLCGELKDRIGYGNMNIVTASLSALTAIVSFFYLGGPPRFWGKKV